MSFNKKLDTVFFRYHIQTKDGIIHHDISLGEYVQKIKNNILIGISFKEYNWTNMDNPELIIK
jgi:hypothetical protein